VRLMDGLPSSNRGWKDGYFFVCGDNWERLPKKGDDYIRIRGRGALLRQLVCVCVLFRTLFLLVYVFFLRLTLVWSMQP
jgi:hypothetical protein